MNVIEFIINAELLGTANKEIAFPAMPETMDRAVQKLKECASGPETCLYQISAMAFAYNRAGIEPDDGKNVTTIEMAPEEAKPYFEGEAGKIFARLSRNKYLLLYAYKKAVKCNRLIPPVALRELIAHAYDRNNPNKHEEQMLLLELTGERGRWLLKQMNLADWGEVEHVDWETASHGKRKALLARIRQECPERGLEILQSCFKNESASSRDELLQCLAMNLSKADEPFLQSVANSDRSGNVKETARRLLCKIPGSELVETYCRLLHGKIHYNLLTGWSYEKLSFVPEMKKLGLEEISPNKKEKDDEYLLRQLAERVPLSFWTVFYDCSPEKAAKRLVQNPPFKDYFNICAPINNFGDNLWAFHTLQANAAEDVLFSLVSLLTVEQREEISYPPKVKDFYTVPASWFNADHRMWGIKFSTWVMKVLMQNRYFYGMSELSERLSVYMPVEMRPYVEQTALQMSEKNQEKSQFCATLLNFMRLKEQIDLLFQ